MNSRLFAKLNEVRKSISWSNSVPYKKTSTAESVSALAGCAFILFTEQSLGVFAENKLKLVVP